VDWNRATKNEKNFEIPTNWLHIHYYEALNLLFRIENALRMLVFLVLKSALSEEWDQLSLSSDDGGETNIAALAKKRASQDEAFGYLGYQTNSPLMFLTSGELVRLLTSESYWPYFNSYFRAAKAAVILKLQEIGNVRNDLAHFRPVRPDDVEVVKQNANQVLSLVEETLVNAIQCSQRVPSNTTDQWFTELSTLGNPLIATTIYQSPDRRWNAVELRFSCPQISLQPDKPTDYVFYDVINLLTPMLLKEFPTLRKHVLFTTEYVPWMGWEQDHHVSFYKECRFTFSHDAITSHLSDIKQDLVAAISQIASETELIQADNLAAGALVALAHVPGRKRPIGEEFAWEFSTDRLAVPPGPDDFPEFWGQLRTWRGNFISDTQDYPWMPTSVSFYKI
jgi:hypothetical protein